MKRKRMKMKEKGGEKLTNSTSFSLSAKNKVKEEEKVAKTNRFNEFQEEVQKDIEREFGISFKNPMDTLAKAEASRRKYQASDKGRLAREKYQNSEKGLAARVKYHNTPKYQEQQREYHKKRYYALKELARRMEEQEKKNS